MKNVNGMERSLVIGVRNGLSVGGSMVVIYVVMVFIILVLESILMSMLVVIIIEMMLMMFGVWVMIFDVCFLILWKFMSRVILVFIMNMYGSGRMLIISRIIIVMVSRRLN